MITDLSAAKLCKLAYTDSPDIAVAGAKIRVFDMLGVMVYAFRGTDPDSVSDWLVDIDADCVHHPVLGPVHDGFYRDAKAAFDILRQRNRGPFVLVGHSKGAAEAVLVAGLFKAEGAPPAALITFGCPCVGDGPLASVLSGIVGTDYRHAGDPVTEVPTWLTHPRVLKEIGSASVDPLTNHSIDTYIEALS